MVVYQPYLFEKRLVSNYITKYLEKSGNANLIDEYELQPFEMIVQKIDLTFVEKLFAICDYYIEGIYTRNSRHIYDIHMIWKSGILNQNLLLTLSKSIAMERQLKGNRTHSCKIGAKPLEILTTIIESDVYKHDYENLTSFMSYDEVTYEECIISLKEIVSSNILPKIMS